MSTSIDVFIAFQKRKEDASPAQQAKAPFAPSELSYTALTSCRAQFARKYRAPRGRTRRGALPVAADVAGARYGCSVTCAFGQNEKDEKEKWKAEMAALFQPCAVKQQNVEAGARPPWSALEYH